MPKLPAARSGTPSTIQSDIMPDPASDANGIGASNGLPAKLKPYAFHKLTIDQVVGSAQAIGDCPFCGKEGKLTINQDSGLLHCFVCGIGGNPASFLKLLHDASDKSTTDYKVLAADRRLLYPETLMHWAAVRSIIDDQWLIPGYCAEGKLHQLYRQTPIMDKGKWTHRLLPTPGIWSDGNVHGLHGVNQFDPDKPEISLTEGVWDGLALWEIMRITKRSDGHLVHTASDSSSLLASHNVLAVPGCKIFSDKWLPLFKDKVVNLWYDSDHPRVNGNKSFIDGLDGMKRVTSILNSNAQYRPSLIRYLKWGEQGYDSDKPSGYDVRDALASGGLTEAGRIAILSQLLDKLTPVPDSWLPRTASNTNGTNHNDIECLTCTDWNTLVQAWRKAMKWTEGLDRALSIMLACILSTRSVGIQLWAKVIGPASCLDGDTVIYDPVDGTHKTVAQRWEEGRSFSVYTIKSDSTIGVAQALPPQKHQPEPIYRVTFQSGKVLKVTGGHQFWNGERYVSVRDIVEELQESSAYPIPNISDSGLLVRQQDADHWMRTTPDSQYDCRPYLCSYDEQPLSQSSNDLDTFPSLVDAQRRIPESHKKDGPLLERRCNLFDQRADLQSILCDSLHEEYIQSDYESESSVREDTALQWQLLSSSAEQSLPTKYQSDKEQSSGQYLSSSTYHDASLPRLLQETGPRFHWLPETFHSTRQQYVLPHKTVRLIVSSLQSEDDAYQVETVPQPFVDISEVSADLFLTRPCIGQKYCQPDTVRQPLPPLQDDCADTPQYFPLKVNSWNLGTSTLTTFDPIIQISLEKIDHYYDFHVPETENYWAEGFFHHNCGKSTLCEAVSVSKRYVKALSTIRGFHSGFKEGDGTDNKSLILRLKDKTLVTKDGDTLLQSPNKDQILSEARDIFDRTSRSDYRNGMGADHEGINMTWLLCGTSALRAIDSSELGSRFLDCVIMESINDDLEDEIGLRAVNAEERAVSIMCNGTAGSSLEPELVHAMQLTGGYIDYLCNNENGRSEQLLNSISPMDNFTKDKLRGLGTFVAYIRARPSTKQQETSGERELSARLIRQHTRLAKCLAVVLSKKSVDREVMRRVRHTALDTARGRTLEIVKVLCQPVHHSGVTTGELAVYMNETDDRLVPMLKFLKDIAVVKQFDAPRMNNQMVSRKKWTVTDKLKNLYAEINKDASGSGKGG